jgi:hypothetical protein
VSIEPDLEDGEGVEGRRLVNIVLNDIDKRTSLMKERPTKTISRRTSLEEFGTTEQLVTSIFGQPC